VLAKLVEAGVVYESYSTAEEIDARNEARGRAKQLGYDNYDRDLTDEQKASFREEGREPAWRLRVPDEDLTYVDLIRGEVAFPAGSFPDFVIVRAGGVPLYTFVNPVDDALMGITHVIRGEDLMPSTARQLSLYRALVEAGVTDFVPRFGHMPLVLGEEGNKKLSKRDPKADLFLQREKGFVHEGLLNYLSLLGWSLAPDRDVFSLDEMIAAFDIADVNPNPARFDQKKAESINGDHIRLLDAADFAARIVPYLAHEGLVDPIPTPEQTAIITASAPLVQERVQLLGDVPGMLGFLFSDEIAYQEDAMKGLPTNASEVLAASVGALELVPEAEFTAASVQEALARALVEELGLKPRVAYGPPRVALTGRRVSPPLFESMELLGKAEAIRRLTALGTHLAE
jgi:glutamyl-tRNA synthetase